MSIELEETRKVIAMVKSGKYPPPSKQQTIVIMDKLLELAEAYEVANDGKNYANELLAKQSAEIEKLRQFHHDQQELHEMNEALQQTNNILREQLADKHQLFMCASGSYDRIVEQLAKLEKDFNACRAALDKTVEQLATVTAERDELVEALERIASSRVVDIAKAALAKLGADKTGESE